MDAASYALLAVTALLAGVAGGVTAARALRRDRSIRAESLDVVDGRGRVRVRIAADDQGRAGVFLFGASGDIRGELSVIEGGVPRLALFDGKGVVRASLIGDSAPALILLHGDGKRRIHLGVEVDGTPSAGFFAKGNRCRAEVSLGSGGKPSILLRDEQGVVRTALGVLADGAPLVASCDEKGRPVWVAPQTRDREPKR